VIARLLLASSLVVTVGCAAVRPLPPPAAAPVDDLTRFIDAALSEAPFDRALWGVAVEDERGAVLYARNRDVLMTPASARKLFSAAAAAECIGLATTLPTTYLLAGTLRGDTLAGDLVIRGGGDPSVGGRHYPAAEEALAPAVRALQRLGVRRITGGVVADVSAFDGQTMPASWKVGSVGRPYAAPVDALAYRENIFDVFVDTRDCARLVPRADPSFLLTEGTLACGASTSVVATIAGAKEVTVSGTVGKGTAPRLVAGSWAVDDPALFAVRALDHLLEIEGIGRGADPRVSREPLGGETFFVADSPPLFELLAIVLKPSRNLWAEMLFKRLAVGRTPASFAEAAAAEERFLRSYGIDPDAVSFVDGSGLSPENRATAAALVAIVRWMDTPGRRGPFRMLLPAPGEAEGTLRRRLAGLEDRLRAKTGTIEGVIALSGLVDGRSGGTRYFSIVVNGSTAPAVETTALIDSIVQRIADF
jgi:serine-type D-Ala-D-Ala carboxypeptidase/endopeptidase (penicillin-binding protein 4)